MGWADERSSYQPALDGVRGLAVAFVVGFHLGLPWAAGGYLGVSVFFTLSGFLITWLLLQEHERTGRIDIRAFYLRRARRLLPAALVCIAAVTALLAAGVLQERTGARVEVYSATFEVANWQALLSGHSYADLFAAPSALAHFWSLAIEEQFYVVWPVALASLLAWAARRRGRASLRTVLTGMFVVFAVSAAVTAHWWSADAAYYASWARFGEILAGAALASLLARRSLPTRAGLLAPVCLAAIVVLCIATPSGTGWPYAGGLPLFALLSVGLIAGLQVDGPVRRLLAWRPLVWLGVISYGVYLFHWPVIVVLDEQRTGLDGLPLIALRLAVTLVLAGSVYAVVEQPVRARLVLARPSWFLSSAATAIAAVVVAVVLVVPELGVRHIGDRVTLLAAPRTAVAPVKPAEPAASTNAASSGAAVNPPTAAAPKGDPEAVEHASAAIASPRSATIASPPSATTVAVLGDSVPDWLLRDAAPTYARTDFVVINAAHEGCDGSANEPLAQAASGKVLVRAVNCTPWPAAYPAVVESLSQSVDIALLVIGQDPALSHMLNGQWVDPCTDMQWYASDVAARIEYLKQHVHSVVLALPAWGGNRSLWFLPPDHEARYTCVRDQLRQTALATGATTIDLADVLCPAGPDGTCPDLRERDGMHVDPEDAPMVFGWILDQLRPHAAAGSALRPS